MRAEAVFRFADQSVPWVTHVFSATTDTEVLTAQDTAEIAEARWGTAAELAGPSASGCWRPGGRCGATAWRSTTRLSASSGTTERRGHPAPPPGFTVLRKS